MQVFQCLRQLLQFQVRYAGEEMCVAIIRGQRQQLCGQLLRSRPCTLVEGVDEHGADPDWIWHEGSPPTLIKVQRHRGMVHESQFDLRQDMPAGADG